LITGRCEWLVQLVQVVGDGRCHGVGSSCVAIILSADIPVREAQYVIPLVTF